MNGLKELKNEGIIFKEEKGKGNDAVWIYRLCFIYNHRFRKAGKVQY